MKLDGLTYEDYKSLIGKKLRIERRGNPAEQYTGTLLGLGDSIIVTGPTTNVNPWRLDVGNGMQVDFLPDAWEVHDESEPGFTD